MKWKLLSQIDVSPSPWFPILKEEVQLPNGKILDYYKSTLSNVAMVLPITVDKEIIFVKQYKHGVGEMCMELPAGRIEVGQTALQAAVKELSEETGIQASESSFKEIGELWPEPSKSTVRVYGFLVTDVTISAVQKLEETEDIEIVRVPLAQLHSLLTDGQIQSSDTLALLSLAQLKNPELF